MNIGLYQIVMSCGTDKWITDYQTFSCISIGQMILWFLALFGIWMLFNAIRSNIEKRRDYDDT
jgi:hypothetical protein